MIHFKNTKNNNFSKKAVISTNEDLAYAFFLPIVFKAWIKIGYHPVCVIVGSVSNWSLSTGKYYTIFKNALEAGGDLVFLDVSKNKLKLYESSAVAQVSRLCPFCLPFDLETYYLSSDADMIPVNKIWFEQQDFNKDIHLFYANGYNHARYAMCYIGAKGHVWNKIVNKNRIAQRMSYGMYGGSISVEKPPEIKDYYCSVIDVMSEVRPNCPKHIQWSHDELYFVRSIKQYRNYPSSCQMIDRQIYNNPSFKNGMIGVPAQLPKGRIDRSNWNNTIVDSNGIIDIHCKRPSYTDENWKELKEKLENIFDKEEMKFIDSYYNDFRSNL